MALNFAKYISGYENFPKKGILFRDFSPLIQNGKVFQKAINTIAKFAKEKNADVIAGPEARGFIVGSPVAYRLGIGFVPARKKGKLPTETVSASFGLEYGKSTLYMEKGSIKPGQRVFLTDDLLATGGTINATAKLVKKLGGKIVGAAFVIELMKLHGRDKLNGEDILSLVKY